MELTLQAVGGDLMVWEIYFQHTLGPLGQVEHCLNTTYHASIVANYIHPFMTKIYSSSASSTVTCHVTNLKSS